MIIANSKEVQSVACKMLCYCIIIAKLLTKEYWLDCSVFCFFIHALFFIINWPFHYNYLQKYVAVMMIINKKWDTLNVSRSGFMFLLLLGKNGEVTYVVSKHVFHSSHFCNIIIVIKLQFKTLLFNVSMFANNKSLNSHHILREVFKTVKMTGVNNPS
jgi:hypothetical protein